MAPLGQLQTVTDWESRLTSYTYHNNGQLNTVTRPNGVTTQYSYDGLGRLSEIEHALGEDALGSYSYTYDLVGNRTQAIETLLQPGEAVPPDRISIDSFESGDLSAWSSSTTDGGDLTASTGAAMLGSYGLQAAINDNHTLYVTDSTPSALSRYRARFYFDPNALTISESKFTIFKATTSTANQRVVTVDFQRDRGDLQVRAVAWTDANTQVQLPWVTISDGPHAVEFDWQAATAAGANDGRFDFWVDGVQWGMETTVDSDTLRVETAHLGILTGPVAGTTGSVYFDAFESRSETSIGLDPAAQPVLPFPEKQDAVFTDGFEGGNWNAWSSATGTSKLAVNAAAALEGSQGLEITTNNTGSTLNAFLTDWTPFDENQYHARFSLDPNTIGLLSNGNCVVLFYGQGRDGYSYTTPFRLCMVKSSGEYRLRADTAKDDGTNVVSQNVTITDEPHTLELAWQSATTTSPSDGSFNLWVDGTLAISLSGVDNDTVRVDNVNFGLSGAQSGTTGSLYLDGFASTRWSYIDVTPPQASAAQPVMVAAAQPKVLALPLPFQGWRLAWMQTGQEETRTISYVYDELYRLTEANSSDGAYFHYTYDANGNRLSETTPAGTLCSYYDIANKLTAVYANGQNMTCPTTAPQGSTIYTWDDNGNLLSDGVTTYTYTQANRLKTITQGTNTTSMVYNGLGDRVQETVNGVTTTFSLDLNTGLTQVLSDGTNTYLYGNGRIGQFAGVESAYFLGDALGSVRQLVDGSGEVTLAKDYEPYGEMMGSTGSGVSSYGYTGEWHSSSTNLVYLRARFYNYSIGQFVTRDIWQGDYEKPASFNKWLYGYSNPVKYVDPSGHIPLLNQYDLTNWFYEELKFNVDHIYTKHIRELMLSAGKFTLANQARGGIAWVYLVKDSAKWDFKHNIRNTLSSESFVFQHEGGYDWYEYSMPGNIFYGYTGRAAGFSAEMLHLGAGYAEVTDPAHEKRGESCCPKMCGTVAIGSEFGPSNTVLYRFCLSMGCYYFNQDWKKTYYDDPLDYQAVEFGVRLYETYKNNLSFQTFQSFLTINRSMLTKGKPIPEDQWHKIDDNLYGPEDFDGPDTAKNAPAVHRLLYWPPLQ